MDTSYLAQQVNTIVGQLHGLFDEIGVPNHERDAREEELFAALSDALHNQVRLVTAEKKGMVEEAQKMITTIRQMEASLDDGRSRKDNSDLRVTYPLTRCLQVLKEKHIQVGRLHRERYEQVKKLAQALESYSLHLEPSFVKLALPPTGPNQSISASFDLSPAYVDKLDAEFTRVYEEYSRRVATVKALAENMIQLWAELGTPQAQTDSAIVKYYRDAPEQLGLHEEDITRLRAKRDKLLDEKKNREKRLRDLKSTVEALWEKLDVEERERKAFMNGNRGCGIRQINEFEDELARLNELKRQNLHLFVEDARFKLQELWDALYLSEDEMLEFTPAFSDVYSDALLEAHEREINRLEILKDQRASTLALVDKHRSLVSERDELAASSLDASRLMMRGQKGERRDPGKLLREEKMRKRIAKELPKVIADLRKALEQWEDEYGRPFLVHGERYLDNLEAEDPKPVPGPRSKTPGPAPTPSNTAASGLNRAKSVGSIKGAPKGLIKTPSLNNHTKPPLQSMHGSLRGAPPASATSTTNPRGSPTRIPARMPLSNLKHGGNSPERGPARPESRLDFPSRPLSAANNPVLRAPPPKMRDLALLPAPDLETPYRSGPATAPFTASIVRHVSPEDPYGGSASSADERFPSRPASRDYFSSSRSTTATSASSAGSYPSSSQQQQTGGGPGLRQISNTSTVITGSENWETYDDNSEPEEDLSEAYFARLRAARAAGKNLGGVTATGGPGQMKRLRGMPPPLVQQSEGRAGSGEWEDEDAF
ncbi:microtubule associated protein-domain-containing protein [Staphylotrichum tortipilum]|uniref:Microtubule associated protein-domain-containing protein n=1 Tax=Staphylotrichum tortipilum TaxID=2831512 RepID=A0AAN6MPZ9_9PEZI|nr:microtubule associated protein-domain-containing protein [Staphylotrichum longicolle]